MQSNITMQSLLTIFVSSGFYLLIFYVNVLYFNWKLFKFRIRSFYLIQIKATLISTITSSIILESHCIKAYCRKRDFHLYLSHSDSTSQTLGCAGPASGNYSISHNWLILRSTKPVYKVLMLIQIVIKLAFSSLSFSSPESSLDEKNATLYLPLEKQKQNEQKSISFFHYPNNTSSDCFYLNYYVSGHFSPHSTD